jgi:hypothetical protein
MIYADIHTLLFVSDQVDIVIMPLLSCWVYYLHQWHNMVDFQMYNPLPLK